MNFLRNFMVGRYGSDELNFFLLIVYIIVSVIGSAANLGWLSIISLVLIILTFFRIFSKNIEKRRGENTKFLQIIWEIKNIFRGKGAKRQAKKNIKNDKEHKYFKCKSCGAISRVPRGKGKIEITCPKCGNVIKGKS